MTLNEYSFEAAYLFFKDTKHDWQNIFIFNYNFQLQIGLVSRRDISFQLKGKNSFSIGQMDLLLDSFISFM